jgi:anthranilate synthase component 2
MKILVVDNYDSFTWNLVNILRKNKQHSFDVIFCDKIDPDNVKNYDKIIFSPGPDIPKPGDIMSQILYFYKSSKSILGICLGLQAIGIYFGGSLTNLEKVVHGRSKKIVITSSDEPLFSGIASPCTVGLYHSWSVSRKDFPDCLCITAESEGRIMALAHKTFDVRGTQFHPESIMTPFGEKMINNWLS